MLEDGGWRPLIGPSLLMLASDWLVLASPEAGGDASDAARLAPDKEPLMHQRMLTGGG